MAKLEETTAAANIRTRIQNLAAELKNLDEHRPPQYAESRWKELREAIQLCRDMGIDIADLLEVEEHRFGHFNVVGTL